MLSFYAPGLCQFLLCSHASYFFNQTFGWELVVLYTALSICGKFLVHAWSRCRSWNEEHSITSLRSKLIVALNELILNVLHANLYMTSSMHGKFTVTGKCCMQNNHLRTKSPVEL